VRLVAPPAFARLEKIIGISLDKVELPEDRPDDPEPFVQNPGGRRSKDTGVF
jgi:hypothetical protein